MSDDIVRLRNEYEDRKSRFAQSDIYSWFSTANLFSIHQRQRAVLAILKRHAFTDLRNLSIFEMGCGGGAVLTEYLGSAHLLKISLAWICYLTAFAMRIISFKVQGLLMQMDNSCRFHLKPLTWSCNPRQFPPFSIQRFAAIFAPICCVFFEVPTLRRENLAA